MNKRLLTLSLCLVGIIESAAYGGLGRESFGGTGNDAAVEAVAKGAYNIAKTGAATATGIYHVAHTGASALVSGAYGLAQTYQGLGDTAKKAVQVAGAAGAVYGGYKWYQHRKAIAAKNAKYQAEHVLSLDGERRYQEIMVEFEKVLKGEKARLDKAVADFLHTYNDPYVRMKALLVEIDKTDQGATALLQRLQSKHPQPQNAAQIRQELQDVLQRNRVMKPDIEQYIRIIDDKFNALLVNIRRRIDLVQQEPVELYQAKGGVRKSLLATDDPFFQITNDLVGYHNDHNLNVATLQRHQNI